MTNEEVKAVIILLEATLGNMPSDKADDVVRGVIALLRTNLMANQQHS